MGNNLRCGFNGRSRKPGRRNTGCRTRVCTATAKGKKEVRKEPFEKVTQALRFPTLLILIQSLVFSQATQTPVPVRESPEQARKLLLYAAQMDADAKRARQSGQQRSLASGRPDVPAEQLIHDRTSTHNGIYVDVPKVYDDSLLQQMLNSAQRSLVGLQGFDQGSLTRAIGAVTGANQQIDSFGITGGIQPATQVTAYGNVTSPFPPPAGTPPAPTTSLPTSQAPSASDILDEQLQLTSQITNLRLLLEGALSDQIMVGKDETFAKPRVTLGFPVIISPEKRYKNAVAIVEVFVETNSQNDASRNGEAPSITALLPQEKTYNVAAISDKSASIGLGLATATLGGSANFLFGHKQYFIVKDQDTLASQFEPTDAEIALISSQQAQPIDKRRLRAFAWQFRPVLGRPYVQAGVRQVFVQLAFPGRGIAPAVKSFGTVRIRTYWRKVNMKTGVLEDILQGSLSEATTATPILNYDMHQKWGAVASFNPTDMEDLGSGKMLIKLDGRLLPGTYLRVGSNIILPGQGTVPSDLKTTRFVANIADLATLKTFVISRDGTEYPLKIQPGGINQFQVDQAHVTAQSLDDATTLLSVPITNFNVNDDIPPVLLIGGKVYGYSDAPIDRNCNPASGRCVLSVALPKGLLASAPLISVKALMLDEDGMQAPLAATRTFTLIPQSHVPDKLVLLSQDQTTATYLVYGHDLSQTKIIFPPRNADPACPPNQLCLQNVGSATGDVTMRLLKLPLDMVKEAGTIVFERAGTNEHPFAVAVPAAPSTTSAAAATATAAASADPKFKERIVVGEDDGTIVGQKLDAFKSAYFGAQPLTIGTRTPTSIKISGLRTTGASAVAKTGEITLYNAAQQPTKVPIEVISSRVEIIAK
jgi:hypothetical protein